MKKIISVLLAAALLLTLVPQFTLMASAAETSGSCGDSAKWNYDASTATLTISGTGKVMTGDLRMGKAWYPYLEKIKSVVVKPGITEIQNYAFANCTKLKSVSLPNTLTSMTDMVFSGCTSLKSIELPDSITNMGAGVFYDCTALTSLRFPKKLEMVWTQILMGCTSLTSVTLPPNAKYIMNYAFRDCTSLNSIELPASLERIDFDAFLNTGIYNRESNYKGNVLHIGVWAIAAKPDAKSISIKAGTKYIADNAFDNHFELTKAELPASLRKISRGAFACCPALKEVLVPAGVREIGSAAFTACDALTLTIMNPSCTIYKSNDTLGTPGKTVIRGYEGSTAQTYAKKYGFTFVAPLFLDVLDSAFYANSVSWAVDNGVTKGTAAGLFSPNDTCSRAQTVTFLWRACGSPEPETTDCPFTDVATGAFYYKAVLWALENGITTGTSPEKFSPDLGCTRGQVVTFLWRAKDKPAPESDANPFTDVKEGKFYTEAVLWAVEKEITKGTSETRFSPDAACTRGQIVTFLNRAFE